MLTALLITLAAVCPAFGAPVSGTGYDLPVWNEYTLNSLAIQALVNLPAGNSFWVGYENGGFAWTNDVMPLLTLTFTMADGSERWFDVFWSAQTPDAYYALPFANPTPSLIACFAATIQVRRVMNSISGTLGLARNSTSIFFR